MAIKLKQTSEPKGAINRTDFREQIRPDKTYWGIPLQYFSVRPDGVYLSSEIAAKLEWTIDERQNDIVNIAALPQILTINSTTTPINPGFWCSYIQETEIKSNN